MSPSHSGCSLFLSTRQRDVIQCTSPPTYGLTWSLINQSTQFVHTDIIESDNFSPSHSFCQCHLFRCSLASCLDATFPPPSSPTLLFVNVTSLVALKHQHCLDAIFPPPSLNLVSTVRRNSVTVS